jgi:LysM repeat protein
LWWHHKVQNGETLASLAKTYHTTATAISQANKLKTLRWNPRAVW